MNNGKLLVISGPSGVGKTVVSHELMKLSDLYVKSISATTRKIRPGEVNGVDYFFVTAEEFERMDKNSELLETTEYNGNRYGTPRHFIEEVMSRGKVAILVIDVPGALNVKKMYNEAITCFLNAESLDEIEQRLRRRKTDSEESIRGRLATAKKELESIESFDYVIMNCEGKLCQAAKKIDALINDLLNKVTS